MVAVSISTAGFTILALVLFWAAGPALEGAYFPVLRDLVVTTSSVKNSRMLIQLTGDRYRECGKPVSIGALVWTEDSWQVAMVTLVDGRAPTGPEAPTRPLGRQKFRMLAVAPPGSQVRMVFEYNCHPLWPTRFSTPPLQVPQ